MQGTSRYAILPAFIGAVVLVISITLVTIIARSPYTHANLDPAFDPAYTRTDQTFVGAPVPLTGDMVAGALASNQVALGKQLFVAEGCATCHGMDGRGGIVGPSIAGTNALKLRSKTLVGPQGMPAYAPGALSDSDLAAIAAYLKAMSK